MGIDDLELAAQEQLLRVLPQKSVAEAMVGADQADFVLCPNQGANPLLHLPGGFVGKCHAQDVGRVDSVILHQVGVAAHQKLGLPAARPGDDTDVPFRLQHRLTLSLIEVFQ